MQPLADHLCEMFGITYDSLRWLMFNDDKSLRAHLRYRALYYGKKQIEFHGFSNQLSSLEPYIDGTVKEYYEKTTGKTFNDSLPCIIYVEGWSEGRPKRYLFPVALLQTE